MDDARLDPRRNFDPPERERIRHVLPWTEERKLNHERWIWLRGLLWKVVWYGGPTLGFLVMFRKEIADWFGGGA